LYKEVQLALDDLSQFLDALIVWVLDKADSEPTKMSALYMLSSIVNRRSNGKQK
jgi:DNA repair/transcription protein MET18/MMS19